MALEHTTPTDKQAALERYIYFFNHLDSQLEHCQIYLDDEIFFQDPFHQVHGINALRAILRKFTRTVSAPHFDVSHRAWDGDTCFIRWQFSGRLTLFGNWCFIGVSELHFNAQGKVYQHIDHWDAGEHFYQRLPFFGRLVQVIRRHI